MTAEEFADQEKYNIDGIEFSGYHYGGVADATFRLMRDFAKYHVKAALKSAFDEGEEAVELYYPLENIK